MKRHLQKHGIWAAAAIAVLALISLFPLLAPEETENALVTVSETVSDALHEIQAPAPPKEHPFVEIIDSCGPYYEGTCVNLRSGPGEEYPAIMKLRSHIVLPVASTTVVNGRTWYQIENKDGVRYPERVQGDWYVAGEYARLFTEIEHGEASEVTAGSTKRIIVDRSDNLLRAYDGDELFMEQHVSVGLDDSPTPRGMFWVIRKMPSRYMQGPLPGISDQYYDLPGVPWDLYFTYQGGAIHGAYWHNNFGAQHSHGCVNLPPAEARKLYEWADVGTSVMVRD